NESVALGQRHEAGRGDGAENGIVPAHQCLDPLQRAVRQRHLGLVDQAQPVVDQRPLETVKQAELGRPDHGAGAGRCSRRTASSASRRTGFSSGPTILSPSASPSRNALSSTRRSKPLMISTGPSKLSALRKRSNSTPSIPGMPKSSTTMPGTSASNCSRKRPSALVITGSKPLNAAAFATNESRGGSASVNNSRGCVIAPALPSSAPARNSAHFSERR